MKLTVYEFSPLDHILEYFLDAMAQDRATKNVSSDLFNEIFR